LGDNREKKQKNHEIDTEERAEDKLQKKRSEKKKRKEKTEKMKT
jgi:hypothetical protein